MSELIDRVYGDHFRALREEMREEMEKKMQKEQETHIVRLFRHFQMYSPELSDTMICLRISEVCGITAEKVMSILAEKKLIPRSDE